VIGTERMQAAQSLYIPKTSWKSKPELQLHQHYICLIIRRIPPPPPQYRINPAITTINIKN